MAEAKEEMEVAEAAQEKGNEEEYDDPEKNLDEILDELKEVEDEGEEGLDEGEHREQISDEENGETEDGGEGSQGKEEGEATDKDKSTDGREKERKEERIDPSKGFLENEQDKMITGSWKYRMKIQAFNYEAREMNQYNIEKLVNLSLSSAIYFFNNGHASGKKLGRMEMFCSSQTTGELAMERVLKLDVSWPIAVYIMRKVNIEDKELAYVKVMPFHAVGMRFKPLHKVQLGGKPSSRSIKVSNIPEGTSDELLQALFPCCINLVKPPEVDGKSPGWAVLECMDKNSAIALLKGYRKVQISANQLKLTLCTTSKSASTLVDAAKKKEASEAKAKKEGEEKEKEGGEEGDEDEEDEEEEDEEGEEKSEKHSTRKGSVGEDDLKLRKQYGTSYRGSRGGSSYRPHRGGRYRPYDRYQDRGRGYQDRRETEALKDQIAMLQENISMLTQSMTPMMMGAGGSSHHSSVSRRQRSDSGRYRDEYTTSNRYSSRGGGDYMSSSYGGGGNSWSDAPYSSGGGGSRKRSYNWDDDYGSTSSRSSSYKKYY